MRFAGVILGACVLGFGVQAIILPQIDSILSFALVFASVIFLGAWVGTSGPRIAYCGAQIVLAYELVNLNHFSINASLVPARDTVCGIMLGIAAMWLIFDHLWPTASTQSMRLLLGITIREIAGLESEPEGCALDSRAKYLEIRTDAISRNFERLRSLVDVSIFEALPRRAQDEATLKHTRDLLPQLRAVLLLKTGLLHHRLTACQSPKSDVVTDVEQRCSELLLDTARLVGGRVLERLGGSRANDGELHLRLHTAEEHARASGSRVDLTELQLCSSLFNVVRHVAFTSL
jgi:multidrug resistance protein MdtO